MRPAAVAVGRAGGRLAAALMATFYGAALVTMLAGHCLDVAYGTALGNKAADGSVLAYGWRTYSLLLFGAVLIRQGITCLGAAARLGRGAGGAGAEVVRTAGVVLAVVAPTIPLHGIFGALISALSVVTALAVAAAGRVPRRAAPRAATAWVMGNTAQ